MEKKRLDNELKRLRTEVMTEQLIATGYSATMDKLELEKNRVPWKGSMTSLDKDALKAANAGISYGKMKAAEAPPITVDIPPHVKKVVVKKMVDLTISEPMTVAKLVKFLHKVESVFPDAEVKLFESKKTTGFYVCVIFQTDGTICGIPKVLLQS